MEWDEMLWDETGSTIIEWDDLDALGGMGGGYNEMG